MGFRTEVREAISNLTERITDAEGLALSVGSSARNYADAAMSRAAEAETIGHHALDVASQAEEIARGAYEKINLVIPAVGEVCTAVQRLEYRGARSDASLREEIGRIDNNFRMLLEYLGAEIAYEPAVEIFEDGERVDFTPAKQYIRKVKKSR